MIFCERVFLQTKMWCKAKGLTQSRNSIAKLYCCSCLVKENRLLLVILFIGIEKKDVIQISRFIQGTKSCSDLDRIRNSSCNRSYHPIKLWKNPFLSSKTILPAPNTNENLLRIINPALLSH